MREITYLEWQQSNPHILCVCVCVLFQNVENII